MNKQKWKSHQLNHQGIMKRNNKLIVKYIKERKKLIPNQEEIDLTKRY